MLSYFSCFHAEWFLFLFNLHWNTPARSQGRVAVFQWLWLEQLYVDAEHMFTLIIMTHKTHSYKESHPDYSHAYKAKGIAHDAQGWTHSYPCRSRTSAGRLQGALQLQAAWWCWNNASCPSVGPARAPPMRLSCTENHLKPWPRFHIQHCVSDSPSWLVSHWRGPHPRERGSPPPKPKQIFLLLPKSPVSGVHPVANLLQLYYLYEATPASPVSELELYRAAAWAGMLAEKPLLAAEERGWEGGTSYQMLIPEVCLKVIYQKEVKTRTCFGSSFFFFFLF